MIDSACMPSLRTTSRYNEKSRSITDANSTAAPIVVVGAVQWLVQISNEVQDTLRGDYLLLWIGVGTFQLIEKLPVRSPYACISVARLNRRIDLKCAPGLPFHDALFDEHDQGVQAHHAGHHDKQHRKSAGRIIRR
jgi:hypothetical protein